MTGKRVCNDEMISFFLHHGYSLAGAYLHAYTASLAIFQVYLDGYGFLDDSIWTVQPADKT